MNESNIFANTEEEGKPYPGRPQLDGTQYTLTVMFDDGTSPLLTGSQLPVDGTTINHNNTNQQAQTSIGHNIRISPITCVKEPEKENTARDHNCNESLSSLSNNSPSPLSDVSREPFSLPPGYPMHHSLMHELGVEPSNNRHLIHGSQAEQGTSPGLGVDAVEKSVVEKQKASTKALPTRQIQKRSRQKQKASSNEEIIPTDMDVLCGRGPAIFDHPGNRAFHRIKHKLQDAYLAANNNSNSNDSKKAISQELVDEVHHRGGRFLKKEEGVWLEISNKYARDKAAQALRTVDLTKQERSARRIYFNTEKEISSKKRRLSDLTKDEVAARALFEKVRDRQQEEKKSTTKKSK